jgi:hypothetical protein
MTDGLTLLRSDHQNYKCSVMHHPFADISVVEQVFSLLWCIAWKYDVVAFLSL